MRIRMWAGAVVLAGICARADQPSSPGVEGKYRVTACLETLPDLPAGIGTSAAWEAGRALSSEIFTSIGITLDWKVDARDCSARGIRIMVQGSTPANQFPGALGYATPSEGDYVVVFYDRIQRSVPAEMVALLLAHVVAHEIARVLEGFSRHSEGGLMKERWTAGDFRRMAHAPLRFTREDLALIYASLARPEVRCRLAGPAKP